MVVGEDGNLDNVGLGRIGILFGSSNRCPVVESNQDVVPETLLVGTKYQALRFKILIHVLLNVFEVIIFPHVV